METFIVWMLVLITPASERAPMVVDNIASKEDCLALRAATLRQFSAGDAVCYRVRRVRP